MIKLFTPLQLKDITLPNRIVLPPMCQYSAQEGFATPWHYIHYGKFAMAKVGTIIQEATAISEQGRISHGDLGIWKDEHICGLKKITDFIKEQGSIAGIQLAHAGRKASCDKPWISRKQIAPNQQNGWQTISSSALAFNPDDNAPISMSLEQIQEVKMDFKAAFIRAQKAGYQIIELHAAHGYLIHQFLSPLTNQRKDQYGGDFENRIRFLLEIIDIIQPLLEKESLWVRISATDWTESGWDLEQSISLARILKNKNIEVVDVSTAGAVREQQIQTGPLYQVPFAQAIKSQTSIKVATVGLITTAEQAEQILQQNQADLIMLGRELLRNPHFSLDAAKILGVDLDWVHQYERAK